jgi:hypothetical protein
MAQATKVAYETQLHPEQPERTVAHSDISALAYQLWQDRGCPDGSPEEEWYRAERQLTRKGNSRSAVS